ncbi:MAG TPA: elongation factor Ts [Gammaproteobacteria bacterium]|nr:elongation factor Ts [Gammaproteobacteria bacterium]
MAITASQVKELRQRTGAGMMECKKALVETDGDIEAAIEQMRKTGMAKADKKADRVAAEGAIIVQTDMDRKNAAILEVNSETDFVSGGEDFQNFAKAVCLKVLNENPVDLEALSASTLESGETVDDTRRALIAKIGEKISVRRFATVSTSGSLGIYLHGNSIGVIVDLAGGNEELAKDIAMHIAASKPACISADQVDPELIAKEREIFTAQAKESGKPDNIIEKMIEGRINKYLKEITLLGQAFVKDPDKTIEKLLSENGAKVLSFQRYEVGEGIEKKEENFADEVMAQVRS